MIVRRLMYRWLLPASIVLPAWLFLGWILFSRDGWGLLPLLLIFIPFRGGEVDSESPAGWPECQGASGAQP